MWFLIAVALGVGGKVVYDKWAKEREEPLDVSGREHTLLGLSSESEAAPRIARGEAPKGPLLPSPLPCVPSSAWTRFCQAMRVGSSGDVAPSNAVGIFGLLPKRLADLGLVGEEKREFSEKAQRMVWVGRFVPPLTEAKFRASPLAQYNAFCDSMKLYDEQLESGKMKAPDGLSRSGALAVLHRAGPRGLEAWASRRAKPTEALVKKVNGIF